MQADAGSSSAGILPKGASDSTHSSLELLLLTVNLSWPISLVVSKRQLLHYQVGRKVFSPWVLDVTERETAERFGLYSSIATMHRVCFSNDLN
jgi:hypothetical protein